MPTATSHSTFPHDSPANNGQRHPPLPPTCSRSSYFAAHLILGSGLAAIAMLFGLVFCRLLDLPRSGQTPAKHRASPLVRSPKPQQEIVLEVKQGQEEQMMQAPNPLFDSRQEMQRDEIGPKEPVVDVPPRLPEPRTPDPIPPRLPQSLTADQIFEQRLQASQDDLLGQLAAVPELRLLSDPEVRKARQAEVAAQATVSRTARDEKRAAEAFRRVNHMSMRFQFPTAQVIAEQDLIAFNTSVRLQQQMRRAALRAGLALEPGPNSKLPFETAIQMAELSKALRNLGFVTVPGLRITNRFASAHLASEKSKVFQLWCDQHHLERYKGTLPTLTQMLQIENEATRLLLVRELTRIMRRGATIQLAARAILDLSPMVRQAAIAGLEQRPASEYVPILLWGLRYPWPPVADHAAVALRALKPSGVVAPLVDMLDLPSPSAPIRDANTNEYTVRELVRLNHLRNCLLCHAPSRDVEDGLVRGLVPTPGASLPMSTSTTATRTGGYYEALGTLDFVRADITYLHQDFSVTLSDIHDAPWPDEQRYDFVTRLQTLRPSDIAEGPASPDNYPQREAVLYALRGLTGKDASTSSKRWREILGLIAEKPTEGKRRFELEKIAVSPTEMNRSR